MHLHDTDLWMWLSYSARLLCFLNIITTHSFWFLVISVSLQLLHAYRGRPCFSLNHNLSSAPAAKCLILSVCLCLRFQVRKYGYPSSFCAVPHYRSLASLWFYYTWIQLSTPTCPVSCTHTEVGSHGKSRATFGCKDNECRDCGYNSWVNWHVEYHPIMSAPAGTITRCPNLWYCDFPMRLWSLESWAWDQNWLSLQPEVPRLLFGWGKSVPLFPLLPTIQTSPIPSQFKVASAREEKTTLSLCGPQSYRETLLSLGRKPAVEAAGEFLIFCFGP